MQYLRTGIHNKPSSHFGAFSNKCTKGKKLHLKSDAITYLFAFNGKEKIDEINGAGNNLDYGFRIYDNKLGRFLSVDPLSAKFPWWSTYQYSGNNPILMIDIDGLEGAKPTLPGSIPTLPKADVNRVINQVKFKEALVHALIKDLNIPEGFKQPYNEDGTPNPDYCLTFNYLMTNVIINKNQSNVPLELLGLSKNVEFFDKALGPKIEKASEGVSIKIIRKAMANGTSKIGTKYSMFLIASRVGAKVASGVIGVAIDVATGESAGKGSTAKEWKENIIRNALNEFLNPPKEEKKMETPTPEENQSVSTYVVPPIIETK